MLVSYTNRILVLLCVLQFLIWGGLAPLFHTSLPLDVAELTTFSGEGVVANYKHPNLPGLLLDLFSWMLGRVEVVYLLSQLSIIAAYLAIYALATEFVGKEKALIATLLTSSIFYYHWPTPEFNHNILQIPFWAWATLMSWRAVTDQRLRHWLALGVISGLMLWAKYSAGILLFWIFVWLLVTKKGRASFTTAGPYLTASVFVLVAAPQAIFLFESQFLPLQYAASRANEGGFGDSLNFLLAQLADHLFFIILFALGGLLGRGAIRDVAPVDREVAIFLLLVVVAPVAMVALLPMISGKGLKAMWGAPMFNFSALVVLVFAGGRFTPARARRVTIASLVLVPVIGSLYVAQHVLRPEFSDSPMRTLWPQAEMADYFRGEYEAQTGAPLQILVASDWLGGLVGGAFIDKPRVMIDGDPIKSPWITDAVVHSTGALFLWQGEPASTQRKFARELGVDMDSYSRAEFIWHPDKSDKPIVIKYIVVPPKGQDM